MRSAVRICLALPKYEASTVSDYSQCRGFFVSANYKVSSYCLADSQKAMVCSARLSKNLLFYSVQNPFVFTLATSLLTCRKIYASFYSVHNPALLSRVLFQSDLLLSLYTTDKEILNGFKSEAS
jgi:hypothetical protein